MRQLAEDLRAAVLQYAITGKLTEQYPEESADTLVSVIIDEKRQLLKDKIINRDKSCDIQDINDDELIEIPDNWKWIRLGQICKKIGAGSTPTGGAKVYVKEGIPFLREQNVLNEGLSLADVAFIPKKINDSMKGSQVKPKDILVNITGASIGRNSVVPDDFIEGNVNQHVLIVRLVNPDLREYIHICLQSPFVLNQMTNKQMGDKPGLSAIKVANFLIPIPPLEEQNRIVKWIHELRPKLKDYEQVERRLAVLKDYFPTNLRHAILQAAMQGKLTEQQEVDGTGEELLEEIKIKKERMLKEGAIKKEKALPKINENEVPFEIPNNWKWIRMGEVISLLSGADFAPEEYNDQGNGIPYMTGASNIDVDHLIINRWTTSPRCIAHDGELLLVCKGSGFGKTVFCDVPETHIARQFMSFRVYWRIDMKYINAVLNWSISRIKAAGKGLIPGIDRPTVLGLLIPLPPLAEQHRIVARLNELLPLCDALEEAR